jgi:hypothetical protein
MAPLLMPTASCLWALQEWRATFAHGRERKAIAYVLQPLPDEAGNAASQEIAAKEGSSTSVSVVGAPSAAEAMIAVAHKRLFATMYFRFMETSNEEADAASAHSARRTD